MNIHPRQYVPILLAKRGERRGVTDLTAASRQSITPMFVLPPVDWDFEAEAPKKSIDAHLATAGRDIVQCWGQAPAFVDPYFVDNGVLLTNGAHPLEFVIDQGNQLGAALIPTVSTLRDADYRAAVQRITSRDKRGACIRLGVDEWPANVGSSALQDLLSDIALAPTDVDLMLDLGDSVVSSQLAVTAVRAEISMLPHLADWRSLVVAGAGFPKSLEDLGKGISVLDRTDWHTYRSLVSGPGVARMPAFADYAVAHPDPIVDVDPRFMSISASFRYTIDDAWLVAKGSLFKGRAGTGYGGSAMQPVAQALVGDARFAGALHCQGDVWLDETARGVGGGGNPEAWRKAATTHHLTHVPLEIANLHGLLGTP